MMLFAVPQASAETISSGDLIKASGAAVYYYGADGKRYVFPTEKTFFSWFENFDSVKTISDTDLASIAIGGNVTYRPGVRMIKITTDPKTYAVAANGTLRHVAGEDIAIALYGADWNTKIDDIPDPFFINYTIGDPINDSTDFNPAQATAGATSINADQIMPPSNGGDETPDDQNPPEEPGTMSFSVNDSTPRPGDVINFTVDANQTDGVREIQILMDDEIVNTCSFTTICTGSFPIPVVTDKETYTAKAITKFINQTELSQQMTIRVEEQTIANGVFIYADRTSVKPGQSTGVTVDAPEITVRRIEIFVDGSGKYVCESGTRSCKYSVEPGSAVGTSVTVHGIVTDDIGRTYRSENLIISVTENDSPMVTIQPDKNTIYTGETVNITVAASDQDGIAYLEILDQSRQIIKHCEGAAPCTYNFGPWNETGSYTFYGRSADLLGAEDEQSTTINVINP